MRLSDISRVMDIERKTFLTPWKANAYEYEITRNRVASYQVLTVTYGDHKQTIIGYCGYWNLAGEAHVSTIAVDPLWQGKGLGELLILSILSQACADVARLATLEVRKSNTVAQSLYQKYLFKTVGQRPRYYQGKEDALLMTVEPLDDNYRLFLRQKKRNLFGRLAGPASPSLSQHAAT
jgi:ribosomal-protein-alanine N-acetyltransferase